jgi:hypothetical protein
MNYTTRYAMLMLCTLFISHHTFTMFKPSAITLSKVSKPTLHPTKKTLLQTLKEQTAANKQLITQYSCNRYTILSNNPYLKSVYNLNHLCADSKEMLHSLKPRSSKTIKPATLNNLAQRKKEYARLQNYCIQQILFLDAVHALNEELAQDLKNVRKQNRYQSMVYLEELLSLTAPKNLQS